MIPRTPMAALSSNANIPGTPATYLPGTPGYLPGTPGRQFNLPGTPRAPQMHLPGTPAVQQVSSTDNTLLKTIPRTPIPTHTAGGLPLARGAQPFTPGVAGP